MLPVLPMLVPEPVSVEGGGGEGRNAGAVSHSFGQQISIPPLIHPYPVGFLFPKTSQLKKDKLRSARLVESRNAFGPSGTCGNRSGQEGKFGRESPTRRKSCARALV